MIIQFYEIQDPKEAEALVALGVDHVGSVIVHQDTWRQASVKETIQFLGPTDAKSSLILLFNDREAVFRALAYYQPDIVHFCELLADRSGDLRFLERLLELQLQVKGEFPQLKIMRSIPIPQRGLSLAVDPMQLAQQFESASDYFLTDTVLPGQGTTDIGIQPVDGFMGITGCPSDWQMARRLVQQSAIPVILAGGISDENVYDGIVAVNPAGVDSCTRTNAVDEQGRPIRFKKDLHKVNRMVHEARRAQAALASL